MPKVECSPLIMKDRETVTILKAIAHIWIRIGSMKALTSDQEGALNSDAGRAWVPRRGRTRR